MQALTIPAPVSGTLLGWVLSPSRVVKADELLGEVRAADGTRHAILAPADGYFSAGPNGGAAVEEGAQLATLHPSRTAADAPRAAVRAAMPAPVLSPTPIAPRPVERPVEARAPSSPPVEVERSAPPTPPARVERRGPPIMMELTMSPDARKRPLPPVPEQERLERKTYYLTPSQMARIRALSDELTSGGEGATGESEILRAAVELLLAHSTPALLAILKENRERERRGRYGSGYPRPGRPPKRK